MKNNNVNDDQFYRVLFEIDVKEDETTNYSCIKEFCDIKSEDEHLININIFFKIIKFEKHPNYYHIHLNFSKESEFHVNNKSKDYKTTLSQILEKNYNIDSFFLADILEELQQGQEIIDLVDNLEISNKNDKSTKFNFIGLAYKKKGEYNSASDNYKKSLKIKLKTLGTEHPDTKSNEENLRILKNDYFLKN